ncbi:hypothetical protein [Mucilaginibacter paludis]|nr:hypothetical protein [Mucilaginibacter paludis]
MLSGKEPVSFKKSVFLTENAYYGGSLNYQAFCQDISNISAQLKKPAAKPRPAKVLNPFEMVHVPDSIRNKLSFFISKAEHDSTQINSAVKIQHLLMKDRANHFEFVDGIYWFKLMNTNANLYYFIHTKAEQVHIIRDYSVENLLIEFAGYFEHNKQSVSEQDKIDYLKALSVDLKNRAERLKPGFYGDYEVRKNPKSGSMSVASHL